MRSSKSILLAFVALLVCTGIATEQDEVKVARRQESSPAPTLSARASSSAAGSSSQGPRSNSRSATPSSSGARARSTASLESASSSASPTSSKSAASSAAHFTGAASSSALPSSVASSSAVPTNGTAQPQPDVLPIQPAITPGMAVAGVIMLLTGAVYTLIGIKNKRLHIFLSAGFLVSLAVTVLIVYVMHPPVSNAIQGAYVVAAVLTGLVFGALSIVFPEVSEGLGCLLGGFCLGMWLLVLKPGGLVTSTSAKAIFIACFSVAIFAFSFSHYTRSYGLIGGISFGGATVVVLGIDCFSRAGLKEFWVYIWKHVVLTVRSDLNDDLLPLGTTTFPHTRGIRVEIAGIILICLLGVISQMKLWKIIKERRNRKAEERANDDRHLEELDEDAGRRIERDNGRDRAQWEAVYGNKEAYAKAVSSETTGSTRKNSGTVVEELEIGKNGVNNIELSELGSSQRTSNAGSASKRSSRDQEGNAVTIRVATDGHDDAPRHPNFDNSAAKGAASLSVPTSPRDVDFNDAKSLKSAKRSSAGTGITQSKRNSDQSTAPPPPEVIPLPFKIPVQGADEDRDDERSSIATFADSDRLPQRRSSRLSGGSIMRKLSARSARSSRAFSESEEALVIPHIEDDCASSLAATVDDLTDDDSRSGISAASSVLRDANDLRGGDASRGDTRTISLAEVGPIVSKRETDEKAAVGGDQSFAADPTKPVEAGSRPTSHADIGAANFPEPPKTSPVDPSATSRPVSLTSSTDPKPQTKSSKNERRKSASSQKMGRPKSTRSVKSATQSEKSGRESVASLAEHLPERLSKAAMSYRTNEWAKHLESAELPDWDELKVDHRGEGFQKGGPIEAAAPVNVAELQQTATGPKPPPVPRSASQKSASNLTHLQSPLSQLAKNPSRMMPQEQQHSMPVRSHSSKTVYQQATSPPNASQTSLYNNNTSNPNLSRSMSMNVPLQPQHSNSRGYRSSSTPISSQILLESPSEESLDSRIFPRSTPSPILPPNTLIGRRDSMIRNKYSSLSINQLPSTPEVESQVGPSDSVSVLGDRVSALDEDEMSLADRKELIQQQRQQSANWPLSSQNLPYNSHQPKRESNVDAQRRENMLSQWRESVRQDLSKEKLPQINAEDRRSAMMNERRQATISQRQGTLATNRRESLLDEKMRRGEMNDLHKEAMRRMQANANKHV